MTIKLIQFKTYKQYNFITKMNGVKIKFHIRYNSYLDSYYINIDKYNSGRYINIINSLAMTTGIDLLSQHPQFNLGNFLVIPMKSELYDQNPSSSTIQNYLMMIMTD